jgi:hypothetical protein
MANYIDNNVEFKNILTPLLSNGGPGPNASFFPEDLTDFGLDYYKDRSKITNESERDMLFTLNAIDIHWGGAELKDGTTLKATLNSTGEMLSILQTAYNYATKYTGTVTGVKINGNSKSPSNGVIDLGTVITDISSITNAINTINTQLSDLSKRIAALESNKIYEVKSITLTNLSCQELSSAKTIPASGGTFTITANNGYSLPNDVTVTGATSSWNKSTGVLTISNVIDEVTVSAKGVANVPTAIAFKSTSNTDLSSCTITGQNGTYQFKVVPSNDKGLITSQSKVVFTSIPSQFEIYNVNTKLSTNTPYDSSITFTVKAISKTNGSISVKADKASSITDTLSITVNEGSVSKVDITTANTRTRDYKGGNVTIALSVTETMFETPTVKWESNGGELSNTSLTGATFKAPENTTTSDKVYTITAKYSDTLKDSMTVTVPGKVESYTWHLSGPASEEQITTQSYINGLTYNQTSKPSTITLKKGYNVMIIPSSWTTPTFGLVSDFSKRYTPFTADDLGITNPSNKKVLVLYTEVENGICYVKWS